MSVASEDTRERAARALFEHDCPGQGHLWPHIGSTEAAADDYRRKVDAVAAVVSPSPVDAEAATCECCGKRCSESITDPESGVDLCPRCAIDGALALASERAAAPPVGDEDAQEWTICDECHFVLYSSGMCHCSMEGKPGKHIVVIAKPSSAAPGVTEATREALGFYADRDNWRERNGVIGQLAAPADADRGERTRAALAVSPVAKTNANIEKAAQALIEREADQMEAHTDGEGTLDRWDACDEETREQYRSEVRFVAAALGVSPVPTEGPNCPECSTPLLPIREGDSERKWLCVRCRRAFAPTEGPDDA